MRIVLLFCLKLLLFRKRAKKELEKLMEKVKSMNEKKEWYKSVGNWFFIIACIILVPILIINLYIMIQSKMNDDKVPNVFGYKPFIVLSNSMEKEIHKGDLVLTKMVDPKGLKKNDVIAFRDAENTVTTHRIIDIVEKEGEKYFITKGDNNNTQDKNLVEFSDVEGIYIARFPSLGSMMKSLSEPVTILIVFFGITLIFVVGFSISNKHQRDLERLEFLEYKRKKEEEEQKKKEASQNTKPPRSKTKKKSNDSNKE